MSKEVYKQLLEVMKSRGGGVFRSGHPGILRHGGRNVYSPGGRSKQCHAQRAFYGGTSG